MEDSERPVVRQLGARIARLRRCKGWTQRELAAEIGCSLQQVSTLERGCWMPRVPVLVRIGATLQVSTDYLLTGRGPRHPRVDLRLRERLPALESLPEPQRDTLVAFLDALILAHRYAGLGEPLDCGGEGSEGGWVR